MEDLIKEARMAIATMGRLPLDIARELVYNIPLADLPTDIFVEIIDLQYAGLL